MKKEQAKKIIENFIRKEVRKSLNEVKRIKANPDIYKELELGDEIEDEDGNLVNQEDQLVLNRGVIIRTNGGYIIEKIPKISNQIQKIFLTHEEIKAIKSWV